MEFVIKSISKKGRFHAQNEDSFVVHEDYVIIADGMGGELNGDIASQLAIFTISKFLNHHLQKAASKEDVQDLSFRAIKEADSKITQYINEHPESFGMGTTVVIIIRKGNKGYVAWCGDSRCYIYSNNILSAITKDHSYVQELIDNNLISIDEAFIHPDNNLITKFVGGGEDACVPEFTSCRLSEGCTIILCSDGLSGYCKNEDIANVVSTSQNDELPLRLYQLAIQKGSNDDITIVTMTPKRKPWSLWKWFHTLI